MMNPKSKTLLWLVLLALVDTFIPIPITALILIYVVTERPPWFTSLVDDIYHPK
jgi:hypothetical protein